MLVALLVVLIILWILGYLPTGGVVVPDMTFFVINDHPVTLLNIIALIVISWIVGLLPSPFCLIASILLVLWVLSILGILAFTGLSQWLVLTIIVGLVFYMLRGIFSATSVD